MRPEMENAGCILTETTAALLRSVLALRPLSIGAAAMSLLGIFCGGHDAFVPGLLTGCVLMTVPVFYLMFRVDLDARLFENLAAHDGMNDALASMDQALKALGLVKKIQSRSLDDRVSGARRLVMRTLAATGLQLVLLFSAAIAIALTT
jgi:hypothetical protein